MLKLQVVAECLSMGEKPWTVFDRQILLDGHHAGGCPWASGPLPGDGVAGGGGALAQLLQGGDFQLSSVSPSVYREELSGSQMFPESQHRC